MCDLNYQPLQDSEDEVIARARRLDLDQMYVVHHAAVLAHSFCPLAAMRYSAACFTELMVSAPALDGAFDTYSQAVGTAVPSSPKVGKSWFLLVADYAFGHQMASDLSKVVKTSGGTVVGEVRHPLNTSDFSSFLLRAQMKARRRAILIGEPRCRRSGE
jgi:Periplasmic binding protein